MECNCRDCGWIGKDSDLIDTEENQIDFTHCPTCESEEVFYDTQDSDTK